MSSTQFERISSDKKARVNQLTNTMSSSASHYLAETQSSSNLPSETQPIVLIKEVGTR